MPAAVLDMMARDSVMTVVCVRCCSIFWGSLDSGSRGVNLPSLFSLLDYSKNKLLDLLARQ
jgi:hypothetical protein